MRTSYMPNSHVGRLGGDPPMGLGRECGLDWGCESRFPAPSHVIIEEKEKGRERTGPRPAATGPMRGAGGALSDRSRNLQSAALPSRLRTSRVNKPRPYTLAGDSLTPAVGLRVDGGPASEDGGVVDQRQLPLVRLPRRSHWRSSSQGARPGPPDPSLRACPSCAWQALASRHQ